jgi:transcriptional regulator with XRE-family HTH domain
MTIGERIRGARKKKGLNQRNLAKMVGVSAQAISKYENNIITPTSSNLLNISKALNVKTEYFFRSTRIKVPEPVFRCAVKIGKKEESKILFSIEDWLERYKIAEYIMGDVAIFKQPSINRKIQNIEDVERVAIDLRKEWNLGFDAIESLISTLENHGIKIGIFTESDRFDALLVLVDKSTPVIVVNGNPKGDRQRLNIAHELGHLILDICNSDLDIEAVALRFGAAFIFPANTAKLEFGIKRKKISLVELHELKHKYGLSMQSLIHRAEELEIISTNQSVKYLNIFMKENWKITEPGKQYPAESQTRFEKIINRGICEEIISISRAEEILGIPMKDIGNKLWEGDEKIRQAFDC